ncbi:MAG: chromate transporter [Thermogemmatispora sp.]|uniref:chromate transporter n=1 Tax=Thermogemmatispora sp. TaxID=1968838 RepID=UPI0026225A74|nr:chromate transporter [Thermogemmatispora sp.]MBX5455359.1 chromate transporter [Thermogemmatispora sp.]
MKNPFLYFWLFLKASLFSTGGFSNFLSLHQDLLANHWAEESDFSQALVIGQLSPGPNGLWVIALGYLTYGYLGAALALLAIMIPPFVALIWETLYQRLGGLRWVEALMRGVSLAVVGITVGNTWTIIGHSASDWRAWVIGSAACLLALSRRVHVFVILLLAAGAGLLLYGGLTLPWWH